LNIFQHTRGISVQITTRQTSSRRRLVERRGSFDL